MVNTILSIISIVISALALLLSVIQNRRLHNDNKRLQVLPIMSEKLMVWSRIRCEVERQKDAFDELNVLVSPYDAFYNNNDIVVSESDFPLFTLLTKNSGNGIGDNICAKEVAIITTTDRLEFRSEKVIFSCPAGETIATKIYANIDEETIKEVQVKIRYTDIFGKPYLLNSTFAMQEFPIAEMALINSCREGENR